MKAAAVTRGALYRHFQDKADLFAAFVRAEAEAVASEIEARSVNASTAAAALPGATAPDVIDALADMLSAAFDRAAIALASGADASAYHESLGRLIKAVVAGATINPR